MRKPLLDLTLGGIICAGVATFANAEQTPTSTPATQTSQQLPQQSLQAKKTYLEQELKELESRERDQLEIEMLEGKIQFLKEKQSLQPQTPIKTPATQSQEPIRQQPASYVLQDEYDDDEYDDDDEQAQRDAEVKRTFGKNRNGIFLRFMAGSMRPKTAFNRKQELGFGFGVGYQRFFSFMGFGKPSKSPLGFRVYVDSFAPFNDGRTQTMSSANIDGLLEFNFPNSYSYFGVFGGVGYARFDMWDSTSQMLSFRSNYHRDTIAYNFGAALTLGAKHRLEFYYKVLPKRNTKKLDFAWDERNIIAFVYQYTF